MSDYQNNSFYPEVTASKLQICFFSPQQQLADSVAQFINRDRYELNYWGESEELENFVINNYEKIDCLVLQVDPSLEPIIAQLWNSEILLPAIIVEGESSIEASVNQTAKYPQPALDRERQTIYHQAELRLYPPQLAEINSYLNLAITKFISLAPGSRPHQHFSQVQSSLVAQQRRLTDKLKERLGYLGVYYKRNRNAFFRNLASEDQQKLQLKLTQGYQQILLNYFDEDIEINRLIDELVDQAFFADISTSQILEIHMELIDDFSNQLKIEGRKDDILLDYRLPLIDVISHLCEMYRRSIPGEDLSLELLFTVE
ncbi:MAG: circadian clock protein KaiA [Cyanobacteria bacterium J06621_8]